MPNIEDLKSNKKKTFKKRDYRPYNLTGTSLDNTIVADDEITPPPEQNNDKVVSVDPNKIKNWEYHDRPESELGDIDSLAEEFKNMGQQIPCIVRTIPKNEKFQYELIAGERRWRAALKASIPLKVLIRNLTNNEAALVQISENSNRSELSDYAKGMSYAKLINNNILTQSDLVEKLKISKQQVSRLLSFSRIPTEITGALKDMSKISARTAEEIKQIAAKGDKYKEAIIKYASQIQEGNIGKTTLNTLVNKHVNNVINTPQSEKVYSYNGRHLYTWRNDNNAIPSIHFPRNVSTLILKGKLNKDKLTDSIKQLLEDLLMNVK